MTLKSERKIRMRDAVHCKGGDVERLGPSPDKEDDASELLQCTKQRMDVRPCQ